MKFLVPFAAFSFCIPCVAESNSPSDFQIYGLLDAGISKVTGLKGGSVFMVNSGIMEGSRWGLRGNHDLGGGYKSVFVLENRFEIDTGLLSSRPVTGTQLPDRMSSPEALGLPNTPQTRDAVEKFGLAFASSELGVNSQGRFFDRQAYVGLITPGGAWLLGRQYTPAFEVAARFDVLNLASAASPQQLISFPAGADIRVSNSFAYRVESNGFSAEAMVAAAENSTSTGRFFGINGIYQGQDYDFGFAHNSRKSELGDSSLKSTVVGAALKLKSGTISAELSRIEDKHPSGLSQIPEPFRSAYSNALKQDKTLYHIGYRHYIDSNSISVALNHLRDYKVAGSNLTSYGFAYIHTLSKRTDINFAVARIDNKRNGQIAPGGNGYSLGFSGAPGQDVNSFSLGLRHSF